MKTYGFIINNGFPIDVKANTEKMATLRFIEKYWKRIKEEGLKDGLRIILLGELTQPNE